MLLMPLGIGLLFPLLEPSESHSQRDISSNSSSSSNNISRSSSNSNMSSQAASAAASLEVLTEASTTTNSDINEIYTLRLVRSHITIELDFSLSDYPCRAQPRRLNQINISDSISPIYSLLRRSVCITAPSVSRPLTVLFSLYHSCVNSISAEGWRLLELDADCDYHVALISFLILTRY